MSGLEGLVTAAVSSLPLAQRANCSEVGTLLGSSHGSSSRVQSVAVTRHISLLEQAWQGG